MIRSRVAAALSALFVTGALVSACATQEQSVAREGAAVLDLGEPFTSSLGDVFVLRIQDEYRVIRCMPKDGPIQGCYEDVFRIGRNDLTDDPNAATGAKVRWNQWMEVPSVPGLHLMFLSPDRIAFLQTVTPPAGATPK